MRSPIRQPDCKTPEVSRLAYRFRRASQIIALLVATLGVVVLSGWVFNVRTLEYIRPTFQSMKVNTALAFLLLGAGLWMARDDNRRGSRRILGLAVAVIGGATLVEYAFHVSLGIDQLLFRDTRTPSLSAYPGRMAIATAICFVLLGLAVTFFEVKKAIALQHALVASCFAFSLVALCGYLYGVKPLYSITSVSTMGLHTSVGLFAASLAYLLARPDKGIVSIAAGESNSGLLLRALVPAIIGIPILIGWLELAGQRANLYDRLFGVALQVLGSIGCLTALTLLIVRSMHRVEYEQFHTEEALRESEEKFRSVFRDAGVGMVIVSPEGRFLAANKAFCDCLGYTEKELLGKTVESVTLPEDWPAFSQKLRETLTEGGFQWFEKRCLHKSGRIVYTGSSASVVRSRKRDPQYLVGQVLDITERKKSEEALAGMSQKLIATQEQERARIGRELHDDINQRLAMLALELQQVQENPSEVQSRLQELRTRTTEISSDVQALSHELHSSKLEYLGVVAGMKSWCREFAERHKVVVNFTNDVSSVVPFEMGVSLFRVLQEALNNAIKHSGVKEIEVQLREESSEIHLIARDSGRGFDVEAASHGKGLGLTTMRERVRLVNGMIAIESRPMGGTTIHVRVPLESDQVQRTAG